MTQPSDSEATVDLLDLVPEFIEDMRLVRRAAPNTLDAYARDMQQTLRLLGTPGGPKPPECWSRQGLQHCMEAMHRRGSSAKSIARMMSTWRSFGDFCLRQRVVASNPARELKPPAFVREKPRGLPREELLERISSIESDTPHGLRDRAMLELFCSCGIRGTEMSALTFGDIDPAARTITIRDRRGDERVLTVGDRVIAAIEAYARATVGLSPDSRALIFRGMNGDMISGRTVQRAVRLRLEELMDGQRVSARTLREAFVLWLIDEGLPIEEVQRRAGHRWLTTTQYYAEHRRSPSAEE